MKFLNVVALLLIVTGAINWGLWGFFQFDFVAWLAKGNTTMLARLIYGIVGLAGVWGLGFFGRCKCGCGGCGCGCCDKGKCRCGSGCGCCNKGSKGPGGPGGSGDSCKL